MKSSLLVLKQLILLVPVVSSTLTVDINDEDSVKAAATLVAEDLMTFYHGDDYGGTLGIFSDEPPVGEYYWWTGSVLWGSLLDLRSRTGNTTYDDTILQGLQWQFGPNANFLPPNWTASVGNDDQGFWAQAALVANETGFVNPPEGEPQWLAVAQEVFNEQSSTKRRVGGSEGCDNALRWQIVSFNNGYNYVNGYFSIGAQIAYLTKNQTASDEAIKTYDALTSIGLITDDFDVYDGAQAPDCETLDMLQFSYAAAILLQGSAYLYNSTNDDVWKTRINGLLDRTLDLFFPDGIAIEVACETEGTCTTDMAFFKGITHRALAQVMKLAPYTVDRILPILKTSAAAAVKTCTGGDNGRMCGFAWSDGKFDNSSAGAQSSVLGALVSVLQSTVEVNNNGSGGDSGNNTSSDGSGSGSGSGSGGSGSSNSTGGGGGNTGASIGVSFSALVGGLLVAGFLG